MGYKARFWAIFAMGLPEDKVKLLDDDPKTLPTTTVKDENELYEEAPDSNCQLICVSLAFLVVLGVFLGMVAFHSPHNDEDSYYKRGLFISQHSFFSFHLPLTGI